MRWVRVRVGDKLVGLGLGLVGLGLGLALGFRASGISFCQA